jgi:hypothetical protein
MILGCGITFNGFFLRQKNNFIFLPSYENIKLKPAAGNLIRLNESDKTEITAEFLANQIPLGI